MMPSFYKVITDSIKRKVYTREYYEELAAKWFMWGYLTEQELADVMAMLDEYFPVEEPTEMQE